MGLGTMRRHHVHRGVVAAAVGVAALMATEGLAEGVAAAREGPPAEPTAEDLNKALDELDRANELVSALRAEVDKVKEDAAAAVAKAEAEAKELVEQANAEVERRVSITRERLQAEHAEAVRVAVEAELAKLAASQKGIATEAVPPKDDEKRAAAPSGAQGGVVIPYFGAKGELDFAKPTEAPKAEPEPAKPAPAEKPAGKPAKGASK